MLAQAFVAFVNDPSRLGIGDHLVVPVVPTVDALRAMHGAASRLLNVGTHPKLKAPAAACLWLLASDTEVHIVSLGRLLGAENPIFGAIGAE